MPVSITLKRSSLSSLIKSTSIVIFPLGVNFKAFVTRLMSIYMSLCLSVHIPKGTLSENVFLSFTPLLDDCNINMSSTSSIICFKTNFSSLFESLPFLSIYISSISFTKDIRSTVEVLILLIIFCYRCLSSWNSSRNSSCPSIEFIGVLISWLTVARRFSYCYFYNKAY